MIALLDESLKIIESFSGEQRMRFYEALVTNLTVANRTFLYDDDESRDVIVARAQIVNELLHRIMNRVVDLHYAYGTWSDADMMVTIDDLASIDEVVKRATMSAVKSSLGTAASL